MSSIKCEKFPNSVYRILILSFRKQVMYNKIWKLNFKTFFFAFFSSKNLKVLIKERTKINFITKCPSLNGRLFFKFNKNQVKRVHTSDGRALYIIHKNQDVFQVLRVFL